MPYDLTNRAIGRRLGKRLYGETGFRCKFCGHNEASELKRRPLIRKCKGCKRQPSITSGTVLEHSKKPLWVWVERLRYLESGDVPTSTEFRAVTGVARSTAWGLNQKLMASHASDGRLEDALELDIAVHCRASRGPALAGEASEYLRLLHEAFRRIDPKIVGLRVDLGEITASFVEILEKEIEPAEPTPFESWLVSQLEGVHGRVSLRWLGRWVAHLCRIWSDRTESLDLLARSPPIRMRELAPH